MNFVKKAVTRMASGFWDYSDTNLTFVERNVLENEQMCTPTPLHVLLDELRKRGFSAERQVPIAIVCRGVRFDEGFRADIIVGSKVIIEIKSVERIANAHKKQLLTYLKLTDMKLGYLLNFGEDMMKRGITRTVNSLPEKNILGDLGALREKNKFVQVTSADGVPPLSFALARIFRRIPAASADSTAIAARIAQAADCSMSRLLSQYFLNATLTRHPLSDTLNRTA